MNILKILGFKGNKRTAAQVAKERLQIIVSHESHRNDNPEFIQKLQAEIIEVISKYIKIDQDKIRVQLERIGDQSVLELNVSLPESSSFEEVKVVQAVQEAIAAAPAAAAIKAKEASPAINKKSDKRKSQTATTAE